jgi:hypothetical protein
MDNANVERDRNHDLASDADGSGGVVGNIHGGSSTRGGGGIGHVLAAETQAARNMIADMADLLGDDAELIANTVEGETNLHDVMQRAFKRIAELNGLMNGIAGMMADLKDRGERFERQRDTLRGLLCEAMSVAEMKRLETPLGTASLRVVPSKAEIANEADIPSKYWKPQPPKLDRKAVLEALKAHEPVPGAYLSNGGVTVAIKMD